jgi:hypothetical protein
VPWYYEELHVLAKGTTKLLATTSVGQIADMDHLLEIVRDIPVRQDDVDWNCVTWVKGALEELALDGTALEQGGVGTDWLMLRDLVVGAAALKLRQKQQVAAR